MLKPKNISAEKPIILLIPFKDCVAKTVFLNGIKTKGVSVKTHCLIVGYVAREILSRMPVWLRESLFPRGSELIAAAHDVGKVSPTFQEKIHLDIQKKGLGIVDPELDKKIGYHYTVSQATVHSCSKYIPEILGRHHGYTPVSVEQSDAEVYGGSGWQKERMNLLNALKKDLMADWPLVTSPIHSDALAGLTTVADWIGSGSLFDEVSEESWKSFICEAIDQAGFITPPTRKGLTFDEIFGFPPRDIQKTLFEATTTQGVYVLEAPMGLGKTEAALFSAYRLLEKKNATGIYFALPTQLTSNKIYERMSQFLSKILDESTSHNRPLLLHSSAWLRDTELGEEGTPGHSWFNVSKRGLLAPFAVGTIDQALMAVMNVKHGFVRAFGLAGKVVILDEVHSYDSYTGTILNELVKALRELHCTVIILSATLTKKQRFSILGLPSTNSASDRTPDPYPLISAASQEGKLRELETAGLDDVKVDLRIFQDNDSAIEEVLLRAERGEQILWIENTVDEAQKHYCLFAAKAKEIGVDCGLLHSRFLKTDRQNNEEKWVKLFGKGGRDSRQEEGRILIGTQVLEQSLDIDADFLVTRICPMDMLFQRMGRLWRHSENDAIRPHEAKREVWILAPALTEAVNTQSNLGKSGKVYSPYILCRTLEVLQNVSGIRLPGDIRSLLEATYLDRNEEGNLAKYKNETERSRDTLSRQALTIVSRGGKTLPESKASTRYSETESTDVLLLKNKWSQDTGTMLRLLDDSELLLPKITDMGKRREIAAELLKNTVSVPVYQAPVAKTRQIHWLKDYVYLGEYEESPFRIAIVQENDDLQGIDFSDISEKYNLTYNSRLGYRADKIGRSEKSGE